MLIIENEIEMPDCHPASPVQKHAKEKNANLLLSTGLAFRTERFPGATCVVPAQKDLGARGSPWEQSGLFAPRKEEFSLCSAKQMLSGSRIFRYLQK